jgi:hypothetical protein
VAVCDNADIQGDELEILGRFDDGLKGESVQVIASCPDCGFVQQASTIGDAKKAADTHNMTCIRQRKHAMQFAGVEKPKLADAFGSFDR